MAGSRKRAERLIAIEHLLLRHPRGLQRAQIARRLCVHRSTIGRDVDEIGQRVPIWEDGEGRLGIDRRHYLTELRLTQDECMAVHLATRLLASRSDERNPHAASAVRKLSEALEGLAPAFSSHVARTADDLDGPDKRQDLAYLTALETLTEAWSSGRRVAIVYQSEPDRQSDYELEPWFIEPYAAGRSTYVIGRLLPPDEARLLKVERIRRARLLDRSYSAPPRLEPTELFAPAWGAWLGNRERVTVRLRFLPRIAHRVLETQWHPSERVKECDDGGIEWEAEVAEWREMLPWILGWGHLVEALDPADLRCEVARHARRMVERYAEVRSEPLVGAEL